MSCQDFVNLHSCASTCAQIQYYQIKFDFLLLGLWLTGLSIRIMSQKRNIFYALVYQSLELVLVYPVIMICTNTQTRLFQFLHSLLAIPVWNDETFIRTISYSDFLCYQFYINFSSGTSQWKLILSDLVFGPQERNQPWEIR